MGLRAEKKDRTRAEILAAAETLFRSEGFESARVKDIAARVPVSVQTLYNYFPSKEAILTQLAVDRFDAERRGAELLTREYLAPEGETSRLDRFRQLLRWGLRALAADRDFLRPVVLHTRLLKARPPTDADAALLGEQLEILDRELVRMYELLQEKGELRDDIPAERMAELLSVVFTDRASRWLVLEDGDPLALEDDVMAALEILFRGFAPLRPDEGGSP